MTPVALRRLLGRLRRRTVAVLRVVADRLRAGGATPLAAQLFRGAAVVDGSARTWCDVADLEAARGRPDRAISDLNRALGLARGHRAAEIVLQGHAILSAGESTMRASAFVLDRVGTLDPAARLASAEALIVAGDPATAWSILVPGPGAASPSVARRWDRVAARLAVAGEDAPDDEQSGTTRQQADMVFERVLAGEDAETIRSVVGHLEASRGLRDAVAMVRRRGRGLPRGARGDLCRALRAGGRFSDALEIAEAHGLPDDPWWERFAEELRLRLAELEGGLAHLLAEAASTGRSSRDADARRVVYAVRRSLPATRTGYSIRTQALVEALLATGEDVTVCSEPGFGPPGTTATVGPVRYRRLAGAPGTGAATADAVRWHADRLADVVVDESVGLLHAASNWRSGYAAAVAGRSVDVPVIYEVRGLWELTSAAHNPERVDSEGYEFEVRMESEVLGGVDRVLAISEAIVPELVRRGADPDAITIVPNGVDVERFRPRPRDPALEAELDLAGHRVIGFAGSVRPLEGLVELMEALATLRTTTERPWRVVIVGDGEGMTELRTEVARRGLEDLVRFVGAVDHAQVDRYLTLFDIAPFPRRPAKVSELVTPLKPLEAMATGATVVVSDVAALAEMVDDGVTGVHFAKGDVEALAAVLGRLIDDDVFAAQLARAARHHVETEQTWDAAARRVVDVYDELRHT